MLRANSETHNKKQPNWAQMPSGAERYAFIEKKLL